jgi:hypothetical protein
MDPRMEVWRRAHHLAMLRDRHHSLSPGELLAAAMDSVEIPQEVQDQAQGWIDAVRTPIAGVHPPPLFMGRGVMIHAK